MNQCICNFSNKADDSEMSCDHMCNNHASLEIPYHTILRILDTTREEEYLFTINYCPVCGRSVNFQKEPSPSKEMVMKNCILCDQNQFIFTDMGSPSKAKLRVSRIQKILTVRTEKEISYTYPVSFCPLCGEKFNSISE